MILVLALLAVAVLLWVRSQSGAPNGGSLPLAGDRQPRSENLHVAKAPVADPSGVPRSVAHSLLAWRVVDLEDAPVPTAVVTVNGKAWPCDVNGRGKTSTEVSQEVDAVVEAQGYSSWRGLLLPGVENKVQLDDGGSLEVTVVDESMVPLQGAVVWLSARPTGEDVLDSVPALPRAASGPDGVARLRAAHGEYFVQARHSVYVNSTQRLKQMGVLAECYRVQIGAAPSRSVVHMTMPYVAGLEVVGGEVAYQSFRGRDSGLHAPGNPDGWAACERIRAEIEARFVGSTVMVQVRDVESVRNGRGYPAIHGHVMVVGCKPQVVNVMPVALAEFERPSRVFALQLEASDQWGGIVLRLKNAGGRPVQSLRVAVAASGDWSQGDVPKIAHKFLTPDQIVSLPVGLYDVTGEGHFEANLPGLSRRGLAVTAGSLQEVVLDCPIELSLVRLELTRDVGTQPLLGGAIELIHEQTGVRATLLVNRFDEPPQLWVPAGIVKLTAQAHEQAKPDHLWRLADEPLTIGGGTDAAPQVVRKSLMLVKVK
ncbi:MAG: hypothetical protein H6838_14070 [Planctomycetes bacterium]|nr:hypothetical protein [Planctomycetota bacterium]